MPRQEQGLMWGFQLWVNLPAKDKMCAPRYQEFPAGSIPEVRRPGALVRVVAGELDGAQGPVRGIATAPLYLDVQLEADSRLEIAVPRGHHAFSYVFSGSLDIGGEDVPDGHLALLSDGERVVLRGAGRALLIAARPLHEPIARYGPFVMNTREEIVQAVRDFQSGNFG
jgi:redox-sensitive bicupin YhaK (pirin superfamily)